MEKANVITCEEKEKWHCKKQRKTGNKKESNIKYVVLRIHDLKDVSPNC